MQYQNTRNAYSNQEKVIFPGAGPLGIPALPAVDFDWRDSQILRFDQALKEEHPENKVVHFFTDDYIFERVWRLPERYMPILARFRAVMAPDFSLYTDHPRAVQQFNLFKKHWLGAYWSSMGMTVIPVPRWVEGEPGSFSWCLEGEPIGSTICISTHGAIKGNERKGMFLLSWHQVIQRLRPTRILLYGDTFPGLDFDGELVHIPNEVMTAKRKYCRKKSKTLEVI